jgi:hypothetical protein
MQQAASESETAGGRQDCLPPTVSCLPSVAYYSTVTLFARLRGWSTSQPRRTAMW